MPEGPELKVTRDNLRKILINKKINDLNIISGRYFPKERNPDNYEELKGLFPLLIKEINVKGKLLYFILENDWILLNTMGMSGRWTKTCQKHCHIELKYENDDKLWFCDPRRFGTIKILKNTGSLDKKLDTLGPDILSSNILFKDFSDIMRKHNRKNITKVIMNQSIISGCGNYIKSESLYRSGISPHNNIEDIDENKLEKLFIEMKKVMQESYESQGATISTYYDIDDKKGKYKFRFLVYGRVYDDFNNKVIREKTPDGRTSHWVKEIQK
jgi:DNA-formamidopyrimidine glycosylase